ncbi:unnamed protein product [Trichogramma brassicae]|uniref:Uncharacterized protein n=1 Tax=Trichogramma brassicae TaxID=86971 RepID=A0A6H5IVL0_9HYME|nr:unnamed protein product [Trichogramma brassicae]
MHQRSDAVTLDSNTLQDTPSSSLATQRHSNYTLSKTIQRNARSRMSSSAHFNSRTTSDLSRQLARLERLANFGARDTGVVCTGWIRPHWHGSHERKHSSVYVRAPQWFCEAGSAVASHITGHLKNTARVFIIIRELYISLLVADTTTLVEGTTSHQRLRMPCASVGDHSAHSVLPPTRNGDEEVILVPHACLTDENILNHKTNDIFNKWDEQFNNRFDWLMQSNKKGYLHTVDGCFLTYKCLRSSIGVELKINCIL